jgi:hypothetical protein
LCLVAPSPFGMEPLEDFDPLTDFDMTCGDDVWFARPQLFFSCSLCPTGQTENKYSHREVSLVFFSTFEPISLIPDSCMQKNGISMLYERASSQLPTLYVCPVQNVLGRVPLIPCFLHGNTNNTIPYSLRYEVPDCAAADSRHDSGTGCRLFEVKVWMWNYGRAFPRKISVANAEAMRRKRVQDSRRRVAETLKRRREASAVRPAE